MQNSTSARRRRRLWRFRTAEFDEASWTLRVDGQPVSLEGKPLEVLHELLLRAGEVVTKEELLDSVWPGISVVEGSLPTAISKLRKALGEDQGDIIDTVPRVGYRLACEVRVDSVETPLAPRFAFAPGDFAPGRSQWRLEKALDGSGAADVWLARHVKTDEPRVFKFAEAPDRLRSLKREAALSRLISNGLGKTAPIPTLMEWNFDAPPFALEYAWGGKDLVAWSRDAGGLAALPLSDRLAVAAQICRAVAAVHDLGVLHKDLKPANILIDEGEHGSIIRLADFGSGLLLDDALLDRFRISDSGSLEGDLDGDALRSVTPAYRAPELSGDAVPTVKSDIYALGLILYQLVAGDFARALAPGWEADVDDSILREDIRLAAEGAPERRLSSAADLAERIERLADRRAEAALVAEQAALLAAQQQREARRAARRPWVLAAAASLGIGLVASSAFAAYALHQRNAAIAAQGISEASYRFLAEDVLASVDPTQASDAEETLVEAVNRTSGAIEQRFADQPLVAGYLYATLGRAFDLRSDYENAFRYYEAAQRSYVRAGASNSVAAVNARLQHAGALAISTQPGSLDRARALVAATEAVIAEQNSANPETAVWRESALGMIALVSEDVPAARRHYQSAYEIARGLPDTFSARQITNFGQRFAFTLLRLGEGAAAERTFRALIDDMTALVGVDHPDTLLLRLNLAQSYLVQQRFDDVIRALDPLLPLMEQRLGRDHRYTLLLLAARQQALGSVERYSEAARDGERLWRAAAAKDGLSSFAAVAGRTDTGISQCRGGDLAAGAANISAALAALRTDLAGRGALEDALQAALANCYINMGRLDDAEALLQDIDRIRVAQLVGDQTWGAQVDLALAQIALGRGDRAQAQVLFDRARGPLAEAQDAYVRSSLASMAQELDTSG